MLAPIRSPELSRQAGIAHGFFTRRGGVSEGIYASLNCGPGSKDDRTAVTENRRRGGADPAPQAGRRSDGRHRCEGDRFGHTHERPPARAQ